MKSVLSPCHFQIRVLYYKTHSDVALSADRRMGSRFRRERQAVAQTIQEESVMAAQVVTKNTLIGEMLQMDMGIAAILMAAGMHCVGCPSSAMESLEEACMVHGMDADQVLKRINDYLANKEK